MTTKVALEVTALIKALQANRTFKGLFFGVDSPVDDEASGLGETLFTSCTLERLVKVSRSTSMIH